MNKTLISLDFINRRLDTVGSLLTEILDSIFEVVKAKKSIGIEGHGVHIYDVDDNAYLGEAKKVVTYEEGGTKFAYVEYENKYGGLDQVDLFDLSDAEILLLAKALNNIFN